jgi:hypothetical protein
MKGVSGMCAYRIVALFMALGIAGEVFAQIPDEAPALSVDVNRVVVYATVRQSNGNFVADLEKILRFWKMERPKTFFPSRVRMFP